MNLSDFLNKYFYYLYFGFFGLLALLCFIFVPLTVDAANSTSQLPYLAQSDNPYYDASEIVDVLSAIQQAYPDKYDSNANFIVFLTSEKAWYNNSLNIDCKAFTVYQCSGFNYPTEWGTVGSLVEPDFSNFVLYGNDYIDVSFENIYKFTLIKRNIGTRYNGYQVVLDSSTAKNYTRRFYSNYDPIHIDNSKFDFYYYQNYPVWTNIGWPTSDKYGNTGYWLSYAVPTNYPGSFSDLPGQEESLNDISNIFNNSSITPLPPYDSSLTVSENLRNYLDVIQGNLVNGLNNLGNSIKSFFDNVQQKLTDITNTLSTNIYNGFQTLMDNIKDFLGDKINAILDKFNEILSSITEIIDDFTDLLSYIQEPFNEQELFDYITASNVFLDYSSISTSITTFINSFNTVSEPSDYVIPIHIENITTFSSVPTFYLHLNILDPVKSIIRSFLWVVVSYGLIAAVIDSLPNYINGGGDEQ